MAIPSYMRLISGHYFDTRDGSGPYTIDADGNATLEGDGGLGGGLWLAGTEAVGVTIADAANSAPLEAIPSGSYVLDIEASAWNSGTLTLKRLGPGGVVWITVTRPSDGTPIAFTANGSSGVAVGANATLALFATGGGPAGVKARLS